MLGKIEYHTAILLSIPFLWFLNFAFCWLFKLVEADTLGWMKSAMPWHIIHSQNKNNEKYLHSNKKINTILSCSTITVIL